MTKNFKPTLQLVERYDKEEKIHLTSVWEIWNERNAKKKLSKRVLVTTTV